MMLKQVLKITTLLFLLLVLHGCGTSRVTIFPIEQTDIIFVEQGETYTAPKDGAFLSKFYLEEIAGAKVK